MKISYLVYLRHTLNYNKNIFDISFFLVRLYGFLCKNGKKSYGNKVLIHILKELKLKGLNPLIVFDSLIKNICPILDIKKTFYGRKVISYPMLISLDRCLFLAISWLITGATLRKEKFFVDGLLLEILDSSKNEGYASNKRKLFYDEILSLRPFIHTWLRLVKNNKKYFKKMDDLKKSNKFLPKK